MATSIEDGLRHAIDEWLGIESNSFGFGKKLKLMWVEEKGVAQPFEDAVPRLIDKIQDEPVFQNNESAKNLKRGQFRDGGLDTLGKLFNHLST